jgi:hypothetical protein
MNLLLMCSTINVETTRKVPQNRILVRGKGSPIEISETLPLDHPNKTKKKPSRVLFNPQQSLTPSQDMAISESLPLDHPNKTRKQLSRVPLNPQQPLTPTQDMALSSPGNIDEINRLPVSLEAREFTGELILSNDLNESPGDLEDTASQPNINNSSAEQLHTHKQTGKSLPDLQPPSGNLDGRLAPYMIAFVHSLYIRHMPDTE